MYVSGDDSEGPKKRVLDGIHVVSGLARNIDRSLQIVLKQGSEDPNRAPLAIPRKPDVSFKGLL